MRRAAKATTGRGPRTEQPLSGWQVFRVPLLLGILTAVGLASALVGDDAWDVLSWLTLALPLAAVVWAWRRRA